MTTTSTNSAANGATSTSVSTSAPRRAVLTLPSDRELHVERTFDATPDRLWRAVTDPALVARWWGRGNPLVVERDEVVRGGHWRYVEQAPEGAPGFEGRYREVVPGQRIERTFEWDGMPGHTSVESATFEPLADGRTRLVTSVLFMTAADRDGMLGAGMEEGMNQSFAALDAVLATL